MMEGISGGQAGIDDLQDSQRDVSAGPAKRQRKAKAPKAPKAPKQYVPGVGTANYAFLIALFQVLKITLIKD